MQQSKVGVRHLLAVIGLLSSLALAVPANAQDTKPSDHSIDDLVNAFPNGLTTEQIDAILDVSDPAALRGALRERLLAEMEARRAAESPVVKESLLQFYRDKLRSMIDAWPQLGSIVSATFEKPQGVHQSIDPMRMLLSVVLLLTVGAVATIGTGIFLKSRRLTGSANGRGPLATTGIWLLLDACQIAAFFIAAIVCYAIMDPVHPLAPGILEILLHAALVVLVVERVFALLTAADGPFGSALGHARSAGRGIYATAVAATILLVLVTAGGRILGLLGMPHDAIVAVVVPISVLPFAFLMIVGWWNRRRIREGLTTSLNLVGRGSAVQFTMPILATIYLIALWLVVVDAIFRGHDNIGLRALGSILLALFGPLAALSLSHAIARYYAGDSATPESKEIIARPVMRIMRAIWIVLVFLIIYGTALIWGVDPRAHFGLGTAAVRLIFNVAIVVLLGFVVWSLILNAIDRAMRRAAAEGESTRAQRVKTLLPLLRRFLLIVLVVIVVMVLLSSMGIQIGPLLAGAGVVGIAIGLGAQQTIADILAGVFFLLEDSFRVGDYVEVGNIRGTVEGISMRSLKLRHHRGAVHTLPFGQMKSLTNYTRDWALMRLEFRVAPDTDTALVKRIVKDIAKELAADPDIGKGFIEPLKSQGIRNVEDGAIVIGVKFIATPGTQFTIRREAYRRILDAFNENGIALVGRSVVVKVEGSDAVPSNVAAAAASEAMQREEEE